MEVKDKFICIDLKGMGVVDMIINKNIVVCVCGGIAAYKVVDVVSKLKKQNADVFVVMSQSATQFVTPLTFQTISNNLVTTSLTDDMGNANINHISLAQNADLFVVAPATANIIGKMVNGIADDIVSTSIIATKAQVLLVPAMNTAMYENPIVQNNIERLKSFGYKFLDPGVGTMAMKGEKSGTGRLPEPESIIKYILEIMA
jgi:phosphopantothenoylcysteine decarboxylase/phosphopantothenate--cysteine ligase